jgi:hypothetical protein
MPEQDIASAESPIDTVDVFTRFRFSPDQLNEDNEVADIVRAVPPSEELPDGRFDTVVVMDSDEAEATAMAGRYHTASVLYHFLIILIL